MKRYCWRESREKNCSYRENKNATRVRKKYLGNERTYRKRRMFAKSRIEISTNLENLRKPLILKSTEKDIDIAHWRGSQNKIENVWFCSGGFSYAIQEKFTA